MHSSHGRSLCEPLGYVSFLNNSESFAYPPKNQFGDAVFRGRGRFFLPGVSTVRWRIAFIAYERGNLPYSRLCSRVQREMSVVRISHRQPSRLAKYF